MDLFFFSSTPGFTLTNIGDHIRVTGQLSQFNGALEIQLTASPAHKLEFLDSVNTLPTPKVFDFSKGINPNVMEGYITNSTTIVPAVEGSYDVISNVFLGITNSGGTLLPDQTVYLTNLTDKVFTMRVSYNYLAQSTNKQKPKTKTKKENGAMSQFHSTGTVMSNN